MVNGSSDPLMNKNEIRTHNRAKSEEIFTEAKEIKIVLKETLISCFYHCFINTTYVS
jgi:hypothetical protein